MYCSIAALARLVRWDFPGWALGQSQCRKWRGTIPGRGCMAAILGGNIEWWSNLLIGSAPNALIVIYHCVSHRGFQEGMSEYALTELDPAAVAVLQGRSLAAERKGNPRAVCGFLRGHLRSGHHRSCLERDSQRGSLAPEVFPATPSDDGKYQWQGTIDPRWSPARTWWMVLR